VSLEAHLQFPTGPGAAFDASFQALGRAVAAASLHLNDDARAAREDAVRQGLDEAGVDDASWVLLLARGTPAWSAFTGRSASAELQVPQAPPEQTEPARIPLIERFAPTVAAHYHSVRARAYTPSSLSAAQVQLLFCVVGTAIREPTHVAIHARLARDAGATTAEVVNACTLAVPSAGYGAWLEASQALDTALNGEP
jgi:alkylhydroperoxidase/carboxymuconolactone decarboxylase family protein YurZ